MENIPYHVNVTIDNAENVCVSVIYAVSYSSLEFSVFFLLRIGIVRGGSLDIANFLNYLD
jgi:hypothetical protein